jgi:hypothetical protein
MSSRQNSYAKAIFERFAVLYGRQKVQSMFGMNEQDMENASEAWEIQLRGTDPKIIKSALESLHKARRDWPPSLSEWIGICQDFNRPEHQAAALPPPKVISEVGKEIAQEIAVSIKRENYDYLFWAKRPGSRQAVQLLAKGAKEDRRLRDILDHLLATDGADCRREDAKAEILRVKG